MARSTRLSTQNPADLADLPKSAGALEAPPSASPSPSPPDSASAPASTRALRRRVITRQHDIKTIARSRLNRQPSSHKSVPEPSPELSSEYEEQDNQETPSATGSVTDTDVDRDTEDYDDEGGGRERGGLGSDDEDGGEEEDKDEDREEDKELADPDVLFSALARKITESDAAVAGAWLDFVRSFLVRRNSTRRSGRGTAQGPFAMWA